MKQRLTTFTRTFTRTITLAIALLFFAQGMHGLTIKIGTIAPLRSPWVKELRKLSLEWSRITDGKVKIKIYAGGITGSEDDMIRKIRMGILGGAVFTNRGLTNIYSDTYVFNIPFLMDSEAEWDYILGQMGPAFENSIEEKGFKVVVWTKVGWIHFFSKKAVRYPADLKKHKISFTTGAPIMEQAWKKSGYHVVPNELKDLMMGLQSGMVNAFYLPPLVAASGQYFALAPHMCSLKIAPLLGGFIVSAKMWKRVPEQHRAEMLEVAQKMSDSLFQKTIELEKEAMAEMKKNGLIFNTIPADARAKWKASSDKGMDVLVGKAFSEEVYGQIRGHLEQFRKGAEKGTAETSKK